MEITENWSKSFAYRLKFGGGNDDQQFRNNFIETKKNESATLPNDALK